MACAAARRVADVGSQTLVDALHTNPDAARWPYLDRLIELREAGLIAPEVWRLICALTDEYETELSAWRRRTLS